MKHKGLLIVPALIAAISATEFVSARENVGGGKIVITPSINASCGKPTAQSDLAVNNVRCRVLTGDMWWDLVNGVYEVPKGSGLHSIFAGSLWIGGVDPGAGLHVAGQTYRQTGNDFWPGPLDTTNASVNSEVCDAFDKHFRITKKEVEAFVANGTTTPAILGWPGNGDKSKGQANYLAPFFDKDGNGKYEPSNGDYPGYDLVSGDAYGDCQEVNCTPVDQLFGDETIWWVFNDMGNIHGETKGKEIGLEIRTQAFGFFTDDEINNMTFYNYRIFNRSTYQLDSCYFGVWCDADLGDYSDDFVGCDVKRGFGYTYNGDNDDAVSAAGYGANPPAVGIDFFRGPIANVGDGKDNNRNCTKDENCEQIGMSGFMYYVNTNNVPNGNPNGATHFYNYLKMRWGNGVHAKYGGDGYTSATGGDCQFMFPGNSDLHDWGTNALADCNTTPTQAAWDEASSGNTPADRRMLESAGPFTLMPGALNVITTGVVWARATSGGPGASVSLLRVVDDKAQALFDNCFRVLDGPTAPDVTVQELDKELILYLSNADPLSNNYNENYSEYDPLIALLDTGGKLVKVDTTYDFEGYKIYQVKDPTVTANDLEDLNRARLVVQCDKKNGVGKVINYEFDQALGAAVPKVKVEGKDAGIAHSFKITKDAFTSVALINHKTYYFLATTYGFNEFKKYAQDIPPGPNPFTPATDGQKKAYKQGRKNIKVYSAIPHIPDGEAGGTEMHSQYGSGPVITRIEGNGNGGMYLQFSSSTVSSILSASDQRFKTPTYLPGNGPVNIKVVDPLNVPINNSFTLRFDSTNLANSTWVLINTTTKDTVQSDKTIKVVNEQLLPQWGLSIAIEQIADPGNAASINNGFLGATKTFAEPTKSWLSGLVDVDGTTYSNWIRSGTITTGTGFTNDYSGVDAGSVYETVLGGTWAPYRLSAASDIPATGFDPTRYYTGPGFKLNLMNQPQMKDLASVDIVLTSDKSKWTRSVVFEMSEDTNFSVNTAGTPNRARKLDFRRAPSVDKNGNAGDGIVSATDPNDADFISATGMGWFPGYAINLETGERLNIAFGENSGLGAISGALVRYNQRATITYGAITGTFQLGEKVTADSSKATANIVTDAAGTMVVETIVGTFQNYDTILGGNSAAKANVTSFLLNTFTVGETVTGGTSGATGVVTANSTGVMNVKTLVGTFQSGEVVTGGTSGSNAKVTAFEPYTQNQNGGDMKWNPTSKTTGYAYWSTNSSTPVFGGQHYIYVFGHNKDNSPTGVTPVDTINVPRYDYGQRIREILSWDNNQPVDSKKRELYRDAMWVSIPLLATGHSLLESEATVRLRVGKSYKPGYSAAYYSSGTSTVYTDIGGTLNNDRPMYSFSTDGIATHTGESEVAVSALDLINVVPNPYYAFSAYETSPLDNRVKITNLPEACTISIYNLGGTLVRKFTKGKASTKLQAFESEVTYSGGAPVVTTNDGSLDWDLKNSAGIPISSGVYIFHVDVPGVGEKIVKWFGIMRPIDLDAF